MGDFVLALCLTFLAYCDLFYNECIIIQKIIKVLILKTKQLWSKQKRPIVIRGKGGFWNVRNFFLNSYYSCGYKVNTLEVYVMFFSYRIFFQCLYQSRVHIMLFTRKIVYRDGEHKNIFQDLGNVQKEEETEIWKGIK